PWWERGYPTIREVGCSGGDILRRAFRLRYGKDLNGQRQLRSVCGGFVKKPAHGYMIATVGKPDLRKGGGKAVCFCGCGGHVPQQAGSVPLNVEQVAGGRQLGEIATRLQAAQ